MTYELHESAEFLSPRTWFLLLMFLAGVSWLSTASPQDRVDNRQLETFRQQNSEIWSALDPRTNQRKSVEAFVSDVRSTMTLDEAPPAVASVIELPEPLTAASRAQLAESGVLIEEYLGGTTYVVSSIPTADLSLMADSLSDLGAAPSVLQPGDKITAAALMPIELQPSLDEEAEEPIPSFTVEFLGAVDEEQARRQLDELGAEILEQLGEHTFSVKRGDVDPEAIAGLMSVKSVDAGPMPFLPLNETARRVAETDQAQRFRMGSSQPVYDGLSGEGIRIAIADSGVDDVHEDFDEVLPNGSAGGSRVYGNRPGSGSHGTHVASIAAGSGLQSDANGFASFSLRGQAPRSLIGDYGSLGSKVSSYHAALVADSSDVTNHSYVQSMNGYGSEARLIDRIVRGNESHNGDSIPARPQVWAAGNNGVIDQYGDEEGYYALFTSAKNTISVGSIDTMDGRVSDFSSLGPTFDGRIKPDVMAPGCNDSIGNSLRITAALNSSQGYIGKCGTSMAAPVVTGIIALMMEAYREETGNPPSLRPSTFKAILVHTARDMVKTRDYAEREFSNPDTSSPIRYYAGPDFATGYGLVDADAASALIRETAMWRESMVNQTGDVETYCMEVEHGASEIRATVAWDDESGSNITSITTNKLVNDLDLELISPSGTTVRPWTLDPLPLTANPGSGGVDPISNANVVPARRDFDHRNNVEMAHLALPESGIWRARLTAFTLPNANSQIYSLVASEPILSNCPP